MDSRISERIPSEDSCPACESLRPPRRLFQKSGIWIEQCTGCGHRFARPPEKDRHVALVYGDDYFGGGGAGYSNYLSEARLLEAHGRRYGKLLKRFAQPGKLLDVGAAAGFILKGLQAEGWHGVGVEPNFSMAQHARDQLGLDVTSMPFEEFKHADPFDAISVIQVVAHFVDPRRAVGHLHALLKPGGICVVETWNVASLSARLLGSSWHEYSPPSVLHWWSPASLGRLFGDFGFESIATGRPAKWVEAGHAKSLIGHKAAEGSLFAKVVATALVVLPNGLRLPYPAEDLFWAVYRKR